MQVSQHPRYAAPARSYMSVTTKKIQQRHIAFIIVQLALLLLLLISGLWVVLSR